MEPHPEKLQLCPPPAFLVHTANRRPCSPRIQGLQHIVDPKPKSPEGGKVVVVVGVESSSCQEQQQHQLLPRPPAHPPSRAWQANQLVSFQPRQRWWGGGGGVPKLENFHQAVDKQSLMSLSFLNSWFIQNNSIHLTYLHVFLRVSFSLFLLISLSDSQSS